MAFSEILVLVFLVNQHLRATVEIKSNIFLVTLKCWTVMEPATIFQLITNYAVSYVAVARPVGLEVMNKYFFCSFLM